MDVTPLIQQGSQIIQSYAGGRFKVSGTFYDTPILIMPEETFSWETNRTVSEMSEKDFAALIDRAGEIDVVLLGCGATMEFLPPFLKETLKNKGLSVEVMDTGAACRTYNVLLAEGRLVAAVLLPV